MNFNTNSFQEFKQVNNLNTKEALNILLLELEKLKQEKESEVNGNGKK